MLRWHGEWKSTRTYFTAGVTSSERRPGNVFPGNGKQRWSEGRIAELERKIGQQALEVDFFEGVLAAHRGATDAAGVDWKSAVYRNVKEEMKAGWGPRVERMMQLGRVSRASFYRLDENASEP